MADNTNQNQRRTLWIMAAAGIFLLVVIGAAVILYSPAVQKKSANENGAATSDSFNPNDGWSDVGLSAVGVDGALSDGTFVSDAPNSPFENAENAVSFELNELKTFESNEYDSTTTTNTDSKLADSVFASDNEVAKSSSNTSEQNSIVDLNKIEKPSNVSAQNDFTVAQIESAKDSSKKSTVAKSTTTTTTNSYKNTSSSAKIVSESSSSNGIPSLWVQVGSFEDVNKANKARSLLEENGYRNVSVLTYTADSKTMYRVRIGPYSSKSDAENVMTKIGKMKQFNNSFVVDSNAPALKH